MLNQAQGIAALPGVAALRDRSAGTSDGHEIRPVG